MKTTKKMRKNKMKKKIRKQYKSNKKKLAILVVSKNKMIRKDEKDRVKKIQ